MPKPATEDVISCPVNPITSAGVIDPTIGIQAYANVDTGSNGSYSNVDTGSNSSYSDASTGSNSSYSDVATGSNTSYSDAA